MLKVTDTIATEWEFECSSDQRRFENLNTLVSSPLPDMTPKYSCSFDAMCLGNCPEAKRLLTGVKTGGCSLIGLETFIVTSPTRPVMQLEGVTEDEVVRRYGLFQALGRPMGYGDMRVRVRRYEYDTHGHRGVALTFSGITLLSWKDQT